MTIDEVWAYILKLAPRTPRFRRDIKNLLADEGLDISDVTAEWLIHKFNEGWFYP